MDPPYLLILYFGIILCRLLFLIFILNFSEPKSKHFEEDNLLQQESIKIKKSQSAVVGGPLAQKMNGAYKMGRWTKDEHFRFWKRSSSLERSGRESKSMSWQGLLHRLVHMRRSSSTSLKSENSRCLSSLIPWIWTIWRSITSCLTWRMRTQEPATLQHREGLKHSQKLRSKSPVFSQKESPLKNNQMVKSRPSLKRR